MVETGYYGGARETRRIDRETYYDWPTTWALIRKLQPNAIIFSDAGPDVRWVGNERGMAGETCWATLNRNDFVPGRADEQRLNSGDRPGTDWVPAECDVSIRPGWFYHEKEDGKVRSAQNLVDLYFSSVGRGASFLLNLPVDRHGQIHENDVQSLLEFRKRIDAIFSKNLARLALVTSTDGRPSRRFQPNNILDDRRATYWAANVVNPEVVIDFGTPRTFNVIRLREHLPLGQRIEEFAIDEWKDGEWKEFALGTSIGNCRLVRTKRINTSKIRVRITKAAVTPALSEIGVFVEP